MTLTDTPLRKAAKFIRGITFKPEDVCSPAEPGAVVCMRTKNIQADIDLSDLIAIPEAFVRRAEQNLIEGDLLISSANSWNLVGKACWVPKLSYRSTAGGFISILRCDRDLVFPRYFYHWVTSGQTQHDLRNCGRQTTNISNLDFDRALELAIPLPCRNGKPDLDEQKRIASILDKADAIRRKLQQSLRLSDDFLRSVFLDMFGDPVTNPKGWETEPLENLTLLDAPMVDPDDPRYENLLHYGPDRIEKESGRLLPAQTAKEDGLISKKFLCDERYLLYSKIRPYLNKVALVESKCLCSADVYPVRPVNDTVTREFLWFLLRSSSFLNYVESCASRANIPKINRGEFAAYECMRPPTALQLVFSKIVKRTLQASQIQSSFYDDSETLFSSLQQRAFRGEL